MKKVTLYHGSHREISEITTNRAMYFTTDIDVAKEYALGLDDCGNYNEESWIYKTEINLEDAILIEDFEEFDPIGYLDYNDMPEMCYNDEAEYFCIKSVKNIELVEMYKNEIFKLETVS